jgi:hypothetical protein
MTEQIDVMKVLKQERTQLAKTLGGIRLGDGSTIRGGVMGGLGVKAKY